jgi:hypothetical protein
MLTHRAHSHDPREPDQTSRSSSGSSVYASTASSSVSSLASQEHADNKPASAMSSNNVDPSVQPKPTQSSAPNDSILASSSSSSSSSPSSSRPLPLRRSSGSSLPPNSRESTYASVHPGPSGLGPRGDSAIPPSSSRPSLSISMPPPLRASLAAAAPIAEVDSPISDSPTSATAPEPGLPLPFRAPTLPPSLASVGGSDLKTILQQKRRMASAPFYSTADRSSAFPLRAPDHLANDDGRPSRRTRSRHNSRAGELLSGSFSFSSPPAQTVDLVRTPSTSALDWEHEGARAMGGLSNVVMTPSTEEWRYLGLDTAAPDREDSASSSASEDEESRHRKAKLFKRPMEPKPYRPALSRQSLTHSGFLLGGTDSGRSSSPVSRANSPVPLDAIGPLDPRRYSACSGARTIDSFVIEADAGKGAYGLVKRAREKGPDGKPVGVSLTSKVFFSLFVGADTSRIRLEKPELIIKYIIKQRILADCWRKHKLLGPIPIEIHVLDYLRRVPSASFVPPPLHMPSDDIQFSPSSSSSLSSSSSPLNAAGHPNICGMLDFFEDAEHYFLVMPKCALRACSRSLFLWF